MQIQAYLDNVFDVGGLLEDAETKNVALEKVEELEDQLSHVRTVYKYVYIALVLRDYCSSASTGATNATKRFRLIFRAWH